MTYESCPAPTLAAPIKYKGETSTAMTVSTTPVPATHFDGRKVVARKFIVAVTPAKMTLILIATNPLGAPTARRA